MGWRGQEKWRKALKSLQYQSLRRCSGAPPGTAQDAVDRISGVESVETKMDVMQARFVARTMCDGSAMEGLWPADFEKSEEESGRERHWTDHEDCGWKAGSDGFETVADCIVERLGLEGMKIFHGEVLAEKWKSSQKKLETKTQERGEHTTLITEGGARQKVSTQRREERIQRGWGLGKVPGWERRAATWYIYLRTDRGRHLPKMRGTRDGMVLGIRVFSE